MNDFAHKRLNTFAFHECNIARHFVPAIVNGDTSGLSDEDCAAFNEWMQSWYNIATKEELRITHYAFDQLDDPDFTTCSICLQWADCVPCTIYAERTGINY